MPIHVYVCVCIYICAHAYICADVSIYVHVPVLMHLPRCISVAPRAASTWFCETSIHPHRVKMRTLRRFALRFSRASYKAVPGCSSEGLSDVEILAQRSVWLFLYQVLSYLVLCRPEEGL